MQLEDWPTLTLEYYNAGLSLNFLGNDGWLTSRTERRDFTEPKGKRFMSIFMPAG